MRCALSSRALLCALGLAAALTACARSAPDLPTDFGSVNATKRLQASDFTKVDLAKSCADIAQEREDLDRRNHLAEAEIKADRTQNQVAGYFAALFILPVVAVDTNEKQVALLDSNQARIDQLLRLSRFKECR